jgi:hypothetical protein
MEQYKISKELFVTVMNIKSELAHFECIKHIIEYRLHQGRLCKESINDFFFKCKNYIASLHYSIHSGTIPEYSGPLFNMEENKKGWTNTYTCYLNLKIYDSENKYQSLVKFSFEQNSAHSEQQCIFDITEFVLNHTKA